VIAPSRLSPATPRRRPGEASWSPHTAWCVARRSCRWHRRERQGPRPVGAGTPGARDRSGEHLPPAAAAGLETLEGVGGLHRFMAWSGPILTDSGGFQIFSLAAAAGLPGRGVVFRSHIDGAELRLTPEACVAAQARMAWTWPWRWTFCPALPAGARRVEAAVETTTRWRGGAAPRCPPADPRSCSASSRAGWTSSCAPLGPEIGACGFEGYALGGFSVGEPPKRCGPRWTGRPRFSGRAAPATSWASEPGGSGQRRGGRVRPVRLRDPDAQRPKRAPPHLARAGCAQERLLEALRRARRPGRATAACRRCSSPTSATCTLRGRHRRGPRHRHNLHFPTLMRRVRWAIMSGRFAALREEVLARGTAGG